MVSEVASALAISEQEVIQAFDNLRRTGLTKAEIETPGFQTNRWTLTSRGYQVGPSLVLDVVAPEITLRLKTKSTQQTDGDFRGSR